MFKGKRQSFGTAYWFLQGHSIAMSRYLNDFYPIYDWQIMKGFFYDNPIQAKVILEDYRRDNAVKQRIVLGCILDGKSKLILVIGGRGQGKTCLAGWIMERIQDTDNKLPIYVVGEGVLHIFPEWVKYADKIEQVPNGAFIILDEASIRYNSRDFFKDANKLLGKMMAIARHKDISVVFITQHPQLIDINILRLRDLTLWKKMNSYDISERGTGKSSKGDKFWNKVRMNMAPRTKKETLFEYPAEKRFINFTSPEPIFWNDRISKSFQNFKFEEDNKEVKDNIVKKGKKEVIYI